MSNPEMWDGSRMKQPPRGKRKRGPLNQKSIAEEIRSGFLYGLKVGRAHIALRKQGFVKCEACHVRFEDLQSALDGLDLHHKRPRSSGIGFRWGRGFGVDDPDNLQLLCRPCHQKTEPQWKSGPPKEAA